VNQLGLINFLMPVVRVTRRLVVRKNWDFGNFFTVEARRENFAYGKVCFAFSEKD